MIVSDTKSFKLVVIAIAFLIVLQILCPMLVKANSDTETLTLNTDQIVMAVSKNSNEGQYLEVISQDGVEISNWEIKDTTIAEATKVNSRKLLIIAKKVGDTVITVTGSNGATAECIIGVDNFDEDESSNTLTLNTDQIVMAVSKNSNEGQYLEIISPDGVEISNWEIKDTTIAEATKVNSRKLFITAKKVGDTVIIVTGSNGVTAECVIGVDKFDEEQNESNKISTDNTTTSKSKLPETGITVNVIIIIIAIAVICIISLVLYKKLKNR